MIEIHYYKIGYLCPYCRYITPEQNIENHAIIWFKKNVGMSEIKCPICSNITLFKEWDMVKYPYVGS